MDKGYNGWANYETWRVNLELIDGYPAEDVLSDMRDVSRDEMVKDLADILEEYAVYSVIEWPEEGTFARSIVDDFLCKVDWEEIAEHYVDDYLQENPIEEEVA